MIFFFKNYTLKKLFKFFINSGVKRLDTNGLESHKFSCCIAHCTVPSCVSELIKSLNSWTIFLITSSVCLEQLKETFPIEVKIIHL